MKREPYTKAPHRRDETFREKRDRLTAFKERLSALAIKSHDDLSRFLELQNATSAEKQRNSLERGIQRKARVMTHTTRKYDEVNNAIRRLDKQIEFMEL